MDWMERRRCTTIPQQMVLVKLMETHRSLAHNETRHKEARAARAKLWAECAKKLNVDGPARTAREWSKLWNDLKCKVRVKMLNMKLHGRAGNSPNASVGLSPLETRVANILTKGTPFLSVRSPSHQTEQLQVKMDDDRSNDFVVYIEEEPVQDAPTDLLHADTGTQDTDNPEETPASPAPSLSGQPATPVSKERPVSSNSEDSQHWDYNALSSSSFLVSKTKSKSDEETKDSKTQSCSDCENIKTNINSVDKRNEVFGQLISEELNHIKPCLRSRTYARILKFLDQAKGLHSDEIKFEAQE